MVKPAIDTVVLSADEVYALFWPSVAKAYNDILGIRVHLALLNDYGETNPLMADYVAEMRSYGNVTFFNPIKNVPTHNLAKIIRFFLASQQGDNVVYIDDIDLLPLNRNFIVDQVADRKPGHMLCVGAEHPSYADTGTVTSQHGCFPVSQMTAEGHVFQKLFNPNSLSYPAWVESLKGIAHFHPEKENICTQHAPYTDNVFSDEYLIRYLMRNKPVPVQHKPRGFDGNQTVDRAFMKQLDMAKLEAGGYLFAHCPKPYYLFSKFNSTLSNYVTRTYGL